MDAKHILTHIFTSSAATIMILVSKLRFLGSRNTIKYFLNTVIYQIFKMATILTAIDCYIYLAHNSTSIVSTTLIVVSMIGFSWSRNTIKQYQNQMFHCHFHFNYSSFVYQFYVGYTCTSHSSAENAYIPTLICSGLGYLHYKSGLRLVPLSSHKT